MSTSRKMQLYLHFPMRPHHLVARGQIKLHIWYLKLHGIKTGWLMNSEMVRVWKEAVPSLHWSNWVEVWNRQAGYPLPGIKNQQCCPLSCDVRLRGVCKGDAKDMYGGLCLQPHSSVPSEAVRGFPALSQRIRQYYLNIDLPSARADEAHLQTLYTGDDWSFL
jgi:hypothetical protein